GLVAQVLMSGLLPFLSILAIGALVATTGGRPSQLPGITTPWSALGLIAALFVLLQVVTAFLGPVTERLAHRLDLLLATRMLGALLSPPTLAHLEEPELADELAQADSVGAERVQMIRVVGALSALSSTRLLAAVSAVALARSLWWAPLALAGAWMASNQWHRREVSRPILALEGSAAGFRRARYLSDLALDKEAAKEPRIFGLERWLSSRFDAHWQAGMRECWKQRDRLRSMLASAALLVPAHALVLGMLARSALGGEVGLEELVVSLQAVLAMIGFGWQADEQYILRLGTAPLPHALAVCEAARSPRFGLPGAGSPPAAPKTGIRFEGVCFAYPGTGRQILRDLDLEVAAGRSLAIVGDNGSGKTTLLKLLCRFYDPTRGAITVDGVDLVKLDPAGWQRRFAAAFQDFPHYPLSARDNIAFGNPSRRDDMQALRRAASAAGIAEAIDRLPAGWDTPLSREFPGGIDPSGGQWQRLALARVLFAVEGGASILVLDEPTANLDIRAEASFYDRFLDLTKGLTTVLVSHRFSTVRRADHIVVLDGGHVVEAGSHAELMALDGRYAVMFNLQAAAYRPSGDA
ncbi:MAG: ABC transporter ATP-binding protein, partial [Actinomycetota bacterium]